MSENRKLIIILIGGWLSLILSSARASNECRPYDIHLLKGPDGGRVDWNPDGTHIAFDHKNPNTGCYDVFEMELSKTPSSMPSIKSTRCLTCDVLGLPPYNKGNPAYHPGGRYLIFQVERNSHPGKKCNLAANPGAGIFNDLWILDLKTKSAAPFVTASDSEHRFLGIHFSGALHPHFSPDGSHLLWSEMLDMPDSSPASKAGKWALKLAKITFDSSGKINPISATQIRQLLPNSESGVGLVESHGFTPDSKRIVFSGNLGYAQSIWLKNDIFTADLDGKNRKALTSEAYNEHAMFSPSSNKIAWMSSEWSSSKDEKKGTEFFTMNTDGTAHCQLSHFNTPGFSESQPGITNAADLSWSPDGLHLVGYSHNRPPQLKDPKENIWLVNFH